MDPVQIAFLAAILVITVIGIKNRLVGAVLMLLFTICLAAWAFVRIEAGAQIQFFFVQVTKPVLLLGSVIFILFGIFRVAQEWRRRPRRHTDS